MVDEDTITLRARSTKGVCVDQFEGNSLLLKSLLSIRPDKPCHKIQDSLFTSSSEYVDYRGVINFCLIFLVLSNIHVALENVKKYGILYDPIQLSEEVFYSQEQSYFSLILLGLHVIALSSLGIEVLLSKGLLSENVGLVIITTLLTSEMVIPAAVLCLTESNAVLACSSAFFVILYLLKLVSYHVTNSWCRKTHVRAEKIRQQLVSPNKIRDAGNGNVQKNFVQYPENLNIKDLFYFIWAPTLCYELNFPRSARIRIMFLVKRVVEISILSQLNLFLFLQCLLPIFNDTVKPLQEMDFLRIIENYIKFSVTYLSTALISTYLFYHSFLNVLAEILRFGDRYFYCAFWNSRTVMDFWQCWSIPIHKFVLRHVYFPLKQHGFNQYQCLTVSFLLSAFCHEYVFDVSVKAIRLWSFLFMIVQVPYIMILDKWLNEKYGNIVCFTFLSFALPFYSLVYFKEYYVKNHPNVEAAG